MVQNRRSVEDSPINELPEQSDLKPRGNFIITTGAVIAVLLGIPGFFIGVFGAVGVITGKKLVAGALGATWGYLAAVGSYELLRRKFDWQRGSRHSDRHLLAGTLAVSSGLAISGAMHETMPVLALIPACSAIMQANDGHAGKAMSTIHLAVLFVGVGIGTWFYTNGVIGKVLLDRVDAMP